MPQETFRRPPYEGSSCLMPSATSRFLPTTRWLLWPLCCESCFCVFPLWVARSSLKLSTNHGTAFHFDAHRVKMPLYRRDGVRFCSCNNTARKSHTAHPTPPAFFLICFYLFAPECKIRSDFICFCWSVTLDLPSFFPFRGGNTFCLLHSPCFSL